MFIDLRNTKITQLKVETAAPRNAMYEVASIIVFH